MLVEFCNRFGKGILHNVAHNLQTKWNLLSLPKNNVMQISESPLKFISTKFMEGIMGYMEKESIYSLI
jgi:hypothetical protein